MTRIVELDWDERSFNYKNMVSVQNIDRSYYNAVLGAFFSPYIEEEYNRPIIIHEFSYGLRDEYLKNFDEIDDKILERSCDFLVENFEINFDIHIVISNRIDKDIYILDGLKWDVWIPENDSRSPLNELYKDRDSIVILKKVDGYDVVGISDSGNIYTCFKSSHQFIRKISNYLYNKYGNI